MFYSEDKQEKKNEEPKAKTPGKEKIIEKEKIQTGNVNILKI